MSFVFKAITSHLSLSLLAAAGLPSLHVACGDGAGVAPPAPDGGSISGSAGAGTVGSGSSGGSSSGGSLSAGDVEDAGTSSSASADSGALDSGFDAPGPDDAGSHEDAAAPDGGLDPNVAPGGNFDLSTWELEEPVGSPGAPTTISPAELEGATGFHDNYFFTDPTDGSMTFWDPENGVTPASEKYPRADLREMTDGGVPASWTPSGASTLSATLKATRIPDQVAVAEIALGSAGPASAKPLLDLYYRASGAIVVAIEDTPEGALVVEYPVGSVPLGTKWSYVLDVRGTTLNVRIDGGVAHKFGLSSLFRRESMYFRAGDDDDSVGKNATIGARVQLYALEVVHGAG